ncbi:MAG: NAD(P)/FAD-dependent oxidoreductase [Eubacterium sp.]|nr:NAD(P)/FAD-dependent oxidoreductase [Eubacterium sp.]
MYDICIIGAGVTGCAVARELSKYDANICVVEKCEDVCCGTSKANSAIVHAGFDAPNGSLKAKLNVQGSEMMERLSKELDFPFQRNGSLVACLDEEELPKLQELYEKGVKNGVKGLRILSKEEALEREPNLSEHVAGALYAPTGGIVCPFLLTIALAENANTNGVQFRFDTEVTDIRREDGGFVLETNKGALKSRYVVNAAGVYADRIHHMVSSENMQITARKGEYCLLDHSAGSHVSHTVFMLPTKMGKGVLVSPTVHGNLIVGPTAVDIENKEGINTTQSGLQELMEKAGLTVKNIPFRQVITSFAGLRAHEAGDDFIIREAADAEQFIDVAGIESPGLSSAPAIGVMVAELLRSRMGLRQKPDFIAQRKGILNPSSLSLEERNDLIRRNPAYGTVVCRCESVTEGEIVDAIRRNVGARSLDGVKRRTRAGMGRCQSGFCSPRTMEILERELHVGMEEITKSGGSSVIVTGRTKEGQKDDGRN